MLPPLPILHDPYPTAAGIPGQALYGGADITEAVDAAGVLHIGCCSRGPDSDFRFRVFRLVGGAWQDIPLQARATGRGSLSVNRYDGRLYWIAWEGSRFERHEIPGAAAFGGGETGNGGGVLDVSADSAMWALYEGAYASDTEVLGAPGLYVRLNKQLAALRAMRDRLFRKV